MTSSENQEAQQEAVPPTPELSNTSLTVAYVLMFVALVTGFVGLISVVIAFVVGSDAQGTYQDSHTSLILRTYFYSWVYLFIGLILSPILIGWFILLFWLIWYLVRMVRGVTALSERRTINDPASFFGFTSKGA
jgi:uncharacterized membrane protein